MLNLNNNNLDKVFKEGLTDLSSTPSDEVWSGIEYQLQRADGRKRMMLIGIVGAAAALIVLGLFVINGFISFHNENQSLLTAESVGFIGSETNIFEQADKQVEKEIIDSEKQKSNFTSGHADMLSADSVESVDNQLSDLLAVVEPQPMVLKGKTGICLKSEIVSAKFLKYNQAYKEHHKEIFVVDETSRKEMAMRVYLGGAVSSAYSSKQSNNSSQSGTFSQGQVSNQESGISTLGGGINVRVEGQSRWSFETGVLFAQLGQEVHRKPASYFSPDYAYSGVSNVLPSAAELTNSMGAVRLNDGSNIDYAHELKNEGMSFVADNSMVSQSDAMRQTLDYLELPFMARYRVIESFVNLSFMGGVSTNFLIGNKAYLISRGKKIEIGETADIKPMALSSSLGLGLDLPITKIIRFNIEPRFKYYMGSISSNDAYDFRPYSFAFYGGVTVLIK